MTTDSSTVVRPSERAEYRSVPPGATIPFPKSSPGAGPPPEACASAAQAPRIVSRASVRLIYRHLRSRCRERSLAPDFERARIDRRQRSAAKAKLEGAPAQAHPDVREVVVVRPDRHVDAERLSCSRVQCVH